MRKLRRNPAKFEMLDLYRAISSQEGYSLDDPEVERIFIERLNDEFSKAKRTPTVLYGLQTQAMFEYIAASLGKSVLIKSEDAGEIYTKEESIEVPDFRILTNEGIEILVEVKNHRQKKFEPFKFKRKSYFEGLQHYADLLKKDLKIAIYWSSWNLWTLISASRFRLDKNQYVLQITDALMYNEMMLLGDYMLATIPPLQLKIMTDPSHGRTIDPDGTCFFKISDVQMSCAGQDIDDDLESSIAFGLMLYSKWDGDQEVETDGDQLQSIIFTVAPEETVNEQEFQVLGNMSEILSRKFLSLTSPKGSIERFSPKLQEANFDPIIPIDYQGKYLKLWRFLQQYKSHNDR